MFVFKWLTHSLGGVRSIPFGFCLVSLKSPHVSDVFYNILIYNLSDRLECKTEGYCSLAECFWALLFLARRNFFLCEFSRNNFVISVWCENPAHAQKLCQQNAVVPWGFQRSVLLACFWPDSLVHGGWSLWLLARWASTEPFLSCLICYHNNLCYKHEWSLGKRGG